MVHEEGGAHTLFQLINICRMPQIGTASGYGTQRECVGRIWKQSASYRMRLRGGYWGMGSMGMDRAASSKNIAGGDFSSRIIQDTIERECGRVGVPGNAMVSVLDTTLVGVEVKCAELTIDIITRV